MYFCSGQPMHFCSGVDSLAPRDRRFGATLHERNHDDPTNNLASRLSHRAANWRPSKRFAPSRRRGLHPTTLARAPRASGPRFASDRSSKRSRSPRMAASRSDDNPKLPDTKPIAPPARTSPRLRSIRLTWGCSGQGVGFSSWACAKLLSWFRHPWSEPVSIIWPLPHQIKLTYGRRTKQPHQHPACGGQGSGERNHSSNRRFRPYRISVRPPGSAETDQVSVDCFISCRSTFRRSSQWPPR